MKKLIPVILCCAMLLAACGSSADSAPAASESTSAAASSEAASSAESIIGGADGPTAIWLTGKLAPHLLGPIAVAAYSYMALVPVIPVSYTHLTLPTIA